MIIDEREIGLTLMNQGKVFGGSNNIIDNPENPFQKTVEQQQCFSQRLLLATAVKNP